MIALVMTVYFNLHFEATVTSSEGTLKTRDRILFILYQMMGLMITDELR